MTLITLTDVRAGYDGPEILRDITLGITAGEIVTVIGPNGSGKSTLARIIVGALRPRVGRVWRKANLRLGYVPQKLAIDPSLPLTVGRFLSLPQRRSARAVDQAIEAAGLPAGLNRQQMVSLSGGQFQRILLARALLSEPELLILDEPNQGLDQPGSAAFYKTIEAVRDETGCGVLLISHDLHVVMSASDRVICLNGHICCEGAPAVVSAAPAYRALFGGGTGGALALYQHRHTHNHDDATHDRAHDR